MAFTNDQLIALVEKRNHLHENTTQENRALFELIARLSKTILNMRAGKPDDNSDTTQLGE